MKGRELAALMEKHGFYDAEVTNLEGVAFHFPKPVQVSNDGTREKHRYFYLAHDGSVCDYDVWGPAEAFAKPQVSEAL